MKPRFVKIVKTTHWLNWWYKYGIIGQTFEVLDVSQWNFVKIEYEKGMFGWLPLDVCEVNPHLRIAKEE